jgi:hypothetical protein
MHVCPLWPDDPHDRTGSGERSSVRLDNQFSEHLLTAHGRRGCSLLAADEIDHSIGKASRLFEVAEVAAVMEFDEP